MCEYAHAYDNYCEKPVLFYRASTDAFAYRYSQVQFTTSLLELSYSISFFLCFRFILLIFGCFLSHCSRLAVFITVQIFAK